MPERAEIEAVTQAYLGRRWATMTKERREQECERMSAALDRVRDARGADEGLPDCEHGYFAAGGTDTCPACDADALDYLERRKAEAARSPQGEDYEAEAVAALYEFARDHWGWGSEEYESVRDAVAVVLSRVSPSRDGTVAVEQPEPDALGGVPPSQPEEDKR